MSTYPCELRRAPFQRDIELPDGNGHMDKLTLQLNSTALVLTSVSFALTVSDDRGGTSELTGAAVADTSGSSGIIVDDAEAGQITLWLAPADVTALGEGVHYYQVVATFPADHAELPNLVRCLIAGELEITEDAVG